MLGSIQWAVRQSSEAENYLTSVERIFEYTNLTAEKEIAPERLKKDDPNFKQDQDIEMDEKFTFERKAIVEKLQSIITRSNMAKSVVYIDKYLKAEHYSYRHGAFTRQALKDLNFQINAGQKIGVVGRTGAGKSTLISALFRYSTLSKLNSIQSLFIVLYRGEFPRIFSISRSFLLQTHFETFLFPKIVLVNNQAWFGTKTVIFVLNTNFNKTIQ